MHYISINAACHNFVSIYIVPTAYSLFNHNLSCAGNLIALFLVHIIQIIQLL